MFLQKLIQPIVKTNDLDHERINHHLKPTAVSSYFFIRFSKFFGPSYFVKALNNKLFKNIQSKILRIFGINSVKNKLGPQNIPQILLHNLLLNFW